ncbi:MAG: caspase family protein [Bacteroidota bacterium]
MKKLLSIVAALSFWAFQTASAQCIKGNCYNGRGTFVYASGAKYKGEFRHGKIHGDGVLYFSNGNKYVGKWVNQYRHGKGKMVFYNGDVYKGHFRKSKFSGKGTIEFKNGDKYVGAWENDLQNGEGTYYYSNGDRYEGHFTNGKLDGQGSMFYKDGAKYIGQWKNNYKDGQGAFFKSNGRKITGIWLSGKFVGDQSTPESLANESAIAVEEDLRDCNRNNCQSGTGTYTYGDGSKWIGEFHRGEPQGQGTCYYINGDKYVGGWKRHAPHGKGIMYYHHGRVLGALWDYGNPTQEIEADQQLIAQEHVEVDHSNEVKIWALVVGVARYAHMPVLKYTDDDAYHIYAFLKSPEGGALPDEQIRVLIDDDATRSNIIRAMRQVFLQADENDVVMMYFSGHGLPGSFLPVDFDGFNNKLQHEDIKEIFKNSKAKHKLCLADACHSGSLMAMRSPMDGTLSKFYNAFENTDGGTALLLSSKGDEYSLEDKGLRQGIFSHYLIRGLKGEADRNDNKIVTIDELFDFVHTKVRSYTGNAQTPTLTGIFDPRMPIAAIR